MRKPNNPNAVDTLNAHVADVAARTKLATWNSFVEELPVPAELMPALMANRPELVRLAQPRAYSKEEGAALLKLIAGLIETNGALREHAAQVAHLVDNWASTFHALATIGSKIQSVANFKPIGEDAP